MSSIIADSLGGLGLRIPFELIYMILGDLATVTEQKDLMYMRLVSKTFAGQILKIVFDGRESPGERRIINGAAWSSTPASLRQEYLYHLVHTRRIDSNVFASIAVPVFEAELARLGLEGDEADARIRQWCTFPMHEVWDFPRVMPSLITHKRSRYESHKKRIEEHCQFMNGRWEMISETDEAARKRRIGHDRQFLRILLHVIDDEQNEALDMLFPTSFVCPDEFNQCFGTTILAFAIRWATLSLVKRLIERIPRVSNQHLHVYLRLAARRIDLEAYDVSTLLFSHFRGIDSGLWAFIEHLIISATKKRSYEDNKGRFAEIQALLNENQMVIRNALRWVVSMPAKPDLLQVLETCFRRLDPRNLYYENPKTQRNLLLAQLLPESPRTNTTLVPKTSCLSAFMTGAYYKHSMQRGIVRGYRCATSYRFNCPCWEDSRYQLSRLCRCRKANVCHCSISLYGYTKPSHHEPRRWNSMISSAAHAGQVNWVDWFLWAGADPRNDPELESLLFWAHRGGIRKQVIQLLVQHGYDLMAMTLPPQKPTIRDTQESPLTLNEVWAAGSERDPLVMAMFDESQSRFWHILWIYEEP